MTAEKEPVADTGIELCDRCRVAEATVALMDNLSEPPRELQLCQRCWTLTQGAVVMNAFREAGEPVVTDLDAEDEELLMQVGRKWSRVFSTA